MASRSSNKAAVPEAKAALDKFKYEVASELGVPLKEGYNGELTLEISDYLKRGESHETVFGFM